MLIKSYKIPTWQSNRGFSRSHCSVFLTGLLRHHWQRAFLLQIQGICQRLWSISWDVYISIYIYLYSTPLYTHISGWIIETHQPEVGLSSGKVPSVTIGVTSLWGLVIHPEISGRINYQKVLKWEIGASLQTRNKFKTTLKTSATFSKKTVTRIHISQSNVNALIGETKKFKKKHLAIQVRLHQWLLVGCE